MNFTYKLINDKNVTIEDKGRDKYGRILGVVTVGNKNRNEELLKEGLAWVYVKFYKEGNYYDLEKKAKENNLNIWKDPNAITPWEWRKMQKEKIHSLELKEKQAEAKTN